MSIFFDFKMSAACLTDSKFSKSHSTNSICAVLYFCLRESIWDWVFSLLRLRKTIFAFLLHKKSTTKAISPPVVPVSATVLPLKSEVFKSSHFLMFITSLIIQLLQEKSKQEWKLQTVCFNLKNFSLLHRYL